MTTVLGLACCTACKSSIWLSASFISARSRPSLSLISSSPRQSSTASAFFGQRDGLGLFGGIRFALAVKTRGKAHAVQAAVFQAVQEGIHLDGVDGAGACALVTRRLGKVADDGHTRALGQRQQVVVVFQQHNAFGCGAAGQRVVGVGVKAAAVVLPRRRGCPAPASAARPGGRPHRLR